MNFTLILFIIIFILIVTCIFCVKTIVKYKNKAKYYLDCYTKILQYKERLQDEITNLHNGDTVNNALDKLSEC